MNANRQAFLDMIAHSEIGAGLLAISDNGYNVIVGSTVIHPDLFTSYADHPRKLVTIRSKPPVLKSTAAGRYQLLERYFDAYKAQLNLPDFGKDSQDAIALQQIGERHALPLIDAGHIVAAIALCANIWASLPGNSYGQHEMQLAQLLNFYEAAGGIITDGEDT